MIIAILWIALLTTAAVVAIQDNPHQLLQRHQHLAKSVSETQILERHAVSKMVRCPAPASLDYSKSDMESFTQTATRPATDTSLPEAATAEASDTAQYRPKYLSSTLPISNKNCKDPGVQTGDGTFYKTGPVSTHSGLDENDTYPFVVERLPAETHTLTLITSLRRPHAYLVPQCTYPRTVLTVPRPLLTTD